VRRQFQNSFRGVQLLDWELSVLLIEGCYFCGTGTVLEPRKGNVLRWTLVPEDW
jgi:hypothetical protein